VNPTTVAVARVGPRRYDAAPPFSPCAPYPEYRLGHLSHENGCYAGVRDALRLLGLDAQRYGSAQWNPLGGIVRPGDRVVVKPNLIWHSHRSRADEWEQVITHGSVVRAIVDYVLLALEEEGYVCIADGPQRDADWDCVLERTGLGAVCDFYGGVSDVPVELLDLRTEFLTVRGDVAFGASPLPGDPLGERVVDVGPHSRFGMSLGVEFHGADYDEAETNTHHHGAVHEYALAETVARADVFINVPKMKTHKKVGVTLGLKNAVGVTTQRNWLPHYTTRVSDGAGDQFPSHTLRNRSERAGIRSLQRLTNHHARFAPTFALAKRLAKPFWGDTQRVVRSGNWYGNDTCWRMVHDVYRALLYFGQDGLPHSEPKRSFTLIDGIIAGEGNGPEVPDAFAAGVLVAGENVVAVDCVATKAMGFDPAKIPLLREAFATSRLPLADFNASDICLVSDEQAWSCRLDDMPTSTSLGLRPHFGWTGHIELDGRRQRWPTFDSEAQPGES